MRGQNSQQGYFFSYISPEARVPEDHPLRGVKRLADEALRKLDGDFRRMYSRMGRPSVPPERLLKSCILMALFSVRSDRLFCEMLDYNILFRWFLDMSLDERSFDASTFSKNRERLLEHEVARKFFEATVGIARDLDLLSNEHFSVDGTLIEAWASLKSFQPKDRPKKNGDDDDSGNPSVGFHGERRSNKTHESTTDPESALYRKGNGKEARLCFSGHALMENRNGLCVDLSVTHAIEKTETEAAKDLIRRQKRKRVPVKTLGADKGYHNKDFVRFLRKCEIKPHIAIITGRQTPGLDWRTIGRKNYRTSIRKRKRVEEIFGWMKTVGNFRRSRFKGIERTQMAAQLVGAAYNLIRISRLAPLPDG